MTKAIIVRKDQLPAKLEDLAEYVLIGGQVLKAQRAKLKAIKLLAKGVAAQEAALQDTQDMAEILLYAEAKLGEMLEGVADPTSSRRGTRQLPEGIDKKHSHYAQQLGQHQDIIAEVVERAREKDEVPIRRHVLQQIQKNKPKPETPPLPKGKYSVIYADPPWQYDNSGLGGAAQKHYSTMPTESICNLKIPVCDVAVLFLWTTNPLLTDALSVLDAWGFSYKTNFVWVKEGRPTYGKLGFYVYGGHELLLLATKGSMLPEEVAKTSIIEAPKDKHSKKPDKCYGIIEAMYPLPEKQKYLELFARQKYSDRWIAWGNQI